MGGDEMSLADAKRMLQWKVAMEALEAADVGADVIALVEKARAVDDTINMMAQALIGGADAKLAKNYIKVEMVGMLPPFERAYVELVRPNGKTSHELRELLRDRLSHVRHLLSQGPPNDGLREGIIEGIEIDLETEKP
jgi:hypothetical protein